MTKLYDQFNVTDHFTVDGKLYQRQGAGWPVDVIVIEGKGESALPYPYVTAPRLYSSWESLGETLDADADVQDGRPDGGVILKSRPQTLTKAAYLDAMASMIDRKVKRTAPEFLWEVTEPVLRMEGLDLTLKAPGLTMVEFSGQLQRAMGLDLVKWPVERPKLESGVGAEDLENLPLMEWLAPLYRE